MFPGQGRHTYGGQQSIIVINNRVTTKGITKVTAKVMAKNTIKDMTDLLVHHQAKVNTDHRVLHQVLHRVKDNIIDLLDLHQANKDNTIDLLAHHQVNMEIIKLGDQETNKIMVICMVVVIIPVHQLIPNLLVLRITIINIPTVVVGKRHC